MVAKNIFIKGAREHNLKNIDIEIPRDELIVFTGLSGSGRGLHRRAVPRDFHRSEDYLEEPALHGWDGDGNLRLSALALRADRRAPLPYLRPGDQATDGRSDRRPGAPHGGGD